MLSGAKVIENNHVSQQRRKKKTTGIPLARDPINVMSFYHI